MSNNEGDSHAFLLLQVDLTNHTFWLKENESQKHYAKKELAKCLIEKLKDYEFDRFSWNGDGGVFVSKAEGRKNYDVVVEAADTVYDLFETWKTDYKELDTQHLDLRVSADVASIFTDEDPSFWTSTNLNKFIKYERKIAEKGFAISQQIKDNLTTQRRNRFEGYLRWVGIKDQIRIWYDSIHQLKEMGQQ